MYSPSIAIFNTIIKDIFKFNGAVSVVLHIMEDLRLRVQEYGGERCIKWKDLFSPIASFDLSLVAAWIFTMSAPASVGLPPSFSNTGNWKAWNFKVPSLTS